MARMGELFQGALEPLYYVSVPSYPCDNIRDCVRTHDISKEKDSARNHTHAGYANCLLGQVAEPRPAQALARAGHCDFDYVKLAGYRWEYTYTYKDR